MSTQISSYALMSDALPVQEQDHLKAVDFLRGFQRNTELVMLEDGLILTPWGGYRSFVNDGTGEVFLAYAHNADDLKVAPLTIEDRDLAKMMDLPLGTKLKGEYLWDSNRVKWILVNPQAMERKWLRSVINSHGDLVQEAGPTYGTLFRQSENRWMNRNVVYTRIRHKNGLCDVLKTAMPESRFTLPEDPLTALTGLSGIFLKAASLRACDLTPEKAEQLIENDFVRHSALIMEGEDPFALAFARRKAKRAQLTVVGLEVRKFLRRRSRDIQRINAVKKIGSYKAVQQGIALLKSSPEKKFAIRFVHGFRKVRWKEVGSKCATVLLVNGSLLIALSLVFGAHFSLLLLGGRVLTRTSGHILLRVRDHMNSDPSDDEAAQIRLKKYCPTYKPTQMLGGKLDPMWLPYLRARTRAEMNTDTSFNARRLTQVPEDWIVLEKIFGNPEGETGTKVRTFQKDNCRGMTGHEEGGLDVEYLSVNGEKIVFAQIDPARRDDSKLFSGVAEFFSNGLKAHPGEPVLMVRFNNEKGTFSKKWLSRKDYRDIFAELLNAPAARIMPDDAPRPRQPQIKAASPSMVANAWKRIGTIARIGKARAVSNASSNPRPL